MRRLTWFASITWLSAAMVACGPAIHTPGEDAGAGDAGPGAVVPDVGESSSALLDDEEGGELLLGSLALEVPGGAVDGETEVSVEAIEEELAGIFTPFSPVFRFEPSGLEFAEPVTVRLPFEGDPETATIFWTSDDGQTYAALATRVEGNVAIATTTHFSRAFVGTACTGASCCTRARGTLDILMNVDSSNSMTEEQASLRAQIPRMARAFASGDVDGDGVQDFPALRSIRLGSVSADMGTAGFTVPTCANADFGDDGILRTAGNPEIAGCRSSYPPFAELRAGAPRTAVDAFVNQVECTAIMGTGGCGFEQQLDASLKAVTDSMSGITFHAGTTGHADGANAGFLRPDSILAAIIMTDENDCSARDGELFNPSSGTYTQDLNLRCFSNPAALHGARRYVDGLQATRRDPQDLVLGLIAGIPTDLAGMDPAVINADPRMQEVIDPVSPNRVAPSCNVPSMGLAFPPRRLVEVAEQLPRQSTVQSICQPDFTPVVDAILRHVADRASGYCPGQ